MKVTNKKLAKFIAKKKQRKEIILSEWTHINHNVLHILLQI